MDRSSLIWVYPVCQRLAKRLLNHLSRQKQTFVAIGALRFKYLTLRVAIFITFSRTLVKSACITKIKFSYSSTKTYVVGTQKNRLNETVLLGT